MKINYTFINYYIILNRFLLRADPLIWNECNLPLVHVYTFITATEEHNHEEVLFQKIRHTLESFEKEDILEIFSVRDVSASSKMYSVSF